jgi:hypothetical protein
VPALRFVPDTPARRSRMHPHSGRTPGDCDSVYAKLGVTSRTEAGAGRNLGACRRGPRQSRQGRAGDRHGDAGTGGNQGTSRGAAPARRRGQALAGASTGAADGLTAGSSAVSSRTGERTMVRGFGGGSCSAMLLRLAATDPPSYVASRLQPSA